MGVDPRPPSRRASRLSTLVRSRPRAVLSVTEQGRLAMLVADLILMERPVRGGVGGQIGFDPVGGEAGGPGQGGQLAVEVEAAADVYDTEWKSGSSETPPPRLIAARLNS